MVTKGSLSMGCNVLETKALAICRRTHYGSVKELSIDNPLMKEAIELDHAIKKLKSLQKGFRNELKLLPSETERWPTGGREDRGRHIPEGAVSLKGDEFFMVVNGKEYRE